MTTPDPFLDTASQRQATGFDMGARKLMLNVIAGVADPSSTVHDYFFDGRFGDLDDYLQAVDEVWGSSVAGELRLTVSVASADAEEKYRAMNFRGADRAVENVVAQQLLLKVPEPDFRQAIWKTAQRSLNAEALAPSLNEVCRNRGIPWEFDPNEGFRWIGDREVEHHAIRPALSAIEDPRFAEA